MSGLVDSQISRGMHMLRDNLHPDGGCVTITNCPMLSDETPPFLAPGKSKIRLIPVSFPCIVGKLCVVGIGSRRKGITIDCES